VDRFRLKANTPPYEVFGTRYLSSSSNLPEGVLKEYFKGPGATEYGWGYTAIYNGFTGFTKLEIIGDVAHVHLKGACVSSGKDFNIADLITLNLKQFGTIQSVKIYDQFDQTQNPSGTGDSEPICIDPSFTATATASITLTASRTPTPTKTPTVTRTPTITKTPTNTRTPSRTPTPTNTKLPSATPAYTKVTVYFVNKVKYNANTPPFEVEGKRYVSSSADFAKFVLDEYFKGPGLTEKNDYGWIAVFSGFTGYSKFEVKDGVAHVYLKGTCNSAGREYNLADILMVNLKQFNSRIQFVKIYDENGSTQIPDGASDSIPACLAP
jgi:hypothetical protein